MGFGVSGLQGFGFRVYKVWVWGLQGFGFTGLTGFWVYIFQGSAGFTSFRF